MTAKPQKVAGLSQDWITDSLHWRGEVLTGKYAHWCDDWDYLPIDETCPEWPCGCKGDLDRQGRGRRER